MRKTIFSPTLMMLCFLTFLPADTPGQGRTPVIPIFENGDSVEVSGVEIFDKIIYFPVTVNDSSPFAFVLDTGAGWSSALDGEEAASIALESTPIGEGGGAGEERVPFGMTEPVTIAMRGLSFQNRPLLTLPLRRLDAHWGKRKDGLIGGDLLSRLITTIDYEDKRVVFHDATSCEYTGPGERIPVIVDDNFLFVEAEVFLYGSEEGTKALFLVDTGVRMSIFNTPFSKNHDLSAQSPGTVTGIMGYGIGGVTMGTAGRVRAVRIGPILFDEPVMSFSAAENGILADTSIAGIIGADFLSRFTVVFDYSRSAIFLEKNGSFGTPFEFDMCGIRFSLGGDDFDHMVAFSVYEGSPAALAGIEAGDIVKTIDGREAGEFDWEYLRNYLRRDGAAVRFTVERDGKTREISFRLKKTV